MSRSSPPASSDRKTPVRRPRSPAARPQASTALGGQPRPPRAPVAWRIHAVVQQGADRIADEAMLVAAGVKLQALYDTTPPAARTVVPLPTARTPRDATS